MKLKPMSRIACHTAVAIILSLLLCTETLQSQWPELPDVDLSKFKPADFTDEELDIPYYLKHFHTFANSVVAT